jgi:uncharacterized alpha-E superfamily protein
MLSRTADSLYWIARYVERAEFTARILDASQRMATLPVHYGGAGTEWTSAVQSTGVSAGFFAKYEHATPEAVRHFLCFDRDNSSSIITCLETARNNARAVRTALTMEMWDNLNGAWIEIQNHTADVKSPDFTHFLDLVKRVSLEFDGSAHRTMLRNDAYWFTRLGMYLERADNTARILDVKYHVLLPENESVGGSLDYFQWTTILREVSALTAYHWVYRKSLKPWLVADLLILNRQLPRSLACCYENLLRALDDIASQYGYRGAAQRQVNATVQKLSQATIEDIFQSGLHEFVLDFLKENNRLGGIISEQYLS